MSWQQVAALTALVAGAIIAAALHNDVIGATLAGAAAGFAVNRNANGSNGNGKPNGTQPQPVASAGRDNGPVSRSP